MRQSRSGRQYTLRRGDAIAEVASIGASLRSFKVGDRDLVLPFDADEIRPLFRGSVLAPWPNRIAGGRWTYEGQNYQLALTEPARGHALARAGGVAGLERDRGRRGQRHTRGHDRPAAGLSVSVRSHDALVARRDGTCRTTVCRERRPRRCAVHIQHSPVPRSAERADGRVEAARSSDARAPGGRRPDPHRAQTRAGSSRLQTSRCPIGPAAIDHAFHGFDFADGVSAVSLVDQIGDGVRVVFGPETPWVQVCTSDWPGRVGHRAGVAVEPMTCPPNAFATSPEMYLVAPGETPTAWWRLEALRGLP